MPPVEVLGQLGNPRCVPVVLAEDDRVWQISSSLNLRKCRVASADGLFFVSEYGHGHCYESRSKDKETSWKILPLVHNKSSMIGLRAC